MKYNQRGMTLVSWLVMLGFAVTLFTMCIKVIPAYLESMTIKKSLQSVADESNVTTMSVFQIRELLNRKFQMNNVKSVKSNDLVIKKESKALVFEMKYEIRVHTIANIDAVLSFDQRVTTE